MIKELTSKEIELANNSDLFLEYLKKTYSKTFSLFFENGKNFIKY